MKHSLSLLVLVVGATLVAQLVAQEPAIPEGFTPLFNGKDLSGWKFQKGEVRDWHAKDGLLVFEPTARGTNVANSHLYTEKAFGNGILIVDYKGDKKLHNGIYWGPLHIKIWDPRKTNPPASEGSGSIGYNDDRVRPTKKADRSLGEWNRFEIRVEENKFISIRLNGELIVDKAEKAFKRPAPIGFQDHGVGISLRNIAFKPLP